MTIFRAVFFHAKSVQQYEIVVTNKSNIIDTKVVSPNRENMRISMASRQRECNNICDILGEKDLSLLYNFHRT